MHTLQRLISFTFNKNSILKSIIRTKVYIKLQDITEWEYSERKSITAEEFGSLIESIRTNDLSPFYILDVREYHEHDIRGLPEYNSQGYKLPIIQLSLDDIYARKWWNIPVDRSVLCISQNGLVSARAQQFLKLYGYIDAFIILIY